MATTRISDVIEPSVFWPYVLEKTAERAKTFESGLVGMNQKFAAELAGGGKTFEAPFWKDLSETGSKIASDNPADVLTLDNITASSMSARRQYRTQGWSTMDLASVLAGDDAAQRIADRVANWWALDLDRIVIATLNGVINANIAQDSGDMVYSAGVGAGGATPTAVMDADVILEAKQTMGDMADELNVLMVHSRIYTNLQKQNLIDFIPNARGEVKIPTYLGYRLVVSDRLPVTQSGADYYYISYLSAPGFVGYGESSVAMPTEIVRNALQGNGSGSEDLITRRQFVIHPLGHHWTETSVAGHFPTNTELETAGNWDRRLPERKQVPFVAIRSKNG